MALDLSKPLRTIKAGNPARLIDENCEGLAVWAEFTGGRWFMAQCRKTDIVAYLENVPERRTLSCWLNVYDHRIHNCTHSTKEVADRAAASTRIACIHITQDYEVGEGLP